MDITSLIDLNVRNGAELGLGLRSRTSARQIISVISKEMIARLCPHVITNRQQIAFMLGESVTNASKSVLIIYIKTVWPDDTKSESAFAYPLDLIELNEVTASYIATHVQNSLQLYGLDHDYLRQNLVGICGDSASNTIGKSSGVLTKFKQIYSKIVLWHCMCHRLELTVHDSIKSTN